MDVEEARAFVSNLMAAGFMPTLALVDRMDLLEAEFAADMEWREAAERVRSAMDECETASGYR